MRVKLYTQRENEKRKHKISTVRVNSQGILGKGSRFPETSWQLFTMRKFILWATNVRILIHNSLEKEHQKKLTKAKTYNTKLI